MGPNVNGAGLQKSFPAGEAEVEVHLGCVCLNSHESAASNIPSLRGPHQLQHEIWMEILLLIKLSLILSIIVSKSPVVDATH